MNVEEFYNYLEYKHLLTVGLTQSGKTTIISNIIRDFANTRHSNKFLIFNTQQQDVLRELGINTSSFESTIKSFSLNQITIYNPKLRFVQEETFLEISQIIQHVFKIQDYFKRTEQQKRVFIVIDEIQQYANKVYGVKVSEIPLIATMGLNPYKINLIAISHKIQQVHNDVISQCPNLIFGFLNDNDYKLCREYYPKLPKINPIQEDYIFCFYNWREFEKIQ